MRKEDWGIPTLGGKARSKAKGKSAWWVGGERSSSIEDPLCTFRMCVDEVGYLLVIKEN